MELTYIGEQYTAHLPEWIKPLQDRATGKQYDWLDVSDMALAGEVHIRPATANEIAAADQHFSLITASLAYLSQFKVGESQ